jgi:hypothetical protein
MIGLACERANMLGASGPAFCNVSQCAKAVSTAALRVVLDWRHIRSDFKSSAIGTPLLIILALAMPKNL